MVRSEHLRRMGHAVPVGAPDGSHPAHAPLHAVVGHEAATVTFEIAATLTALMVLFVYMCLRRPAAPGPDSEELSGVRQGDNPPNGAVVSGPPSTWLESAPADDRALALLENDINLVTSGMSGRVDVRSTAAGAPAVFIYRWVRPAEGKRMEPHGWYLEHVDPRYGTWLVRKEERWP